MHAQYHIHQSRNCSLHDRRVRYLTALRIKEPWHHSRSGFSMIATFTSPATRDVESHLSDFLCTAQSLQIPPLVSVSAKDTRTLGT